MSHYRYYIGADPGKSGALSVIVCPSDPEQLVGVSVTKMPESDRDLADWLRNYCHGPAWACLEKVNAMPRRGVDGGVVKMGAATSFEFGRQFGRVCAVIQTLGIALELVPPKSWQAGLGATRSAKDETYTARKRRLTERAQQLFPGVKVTQQTADSLLIAEYCRRLFSKGV